MRYLVTGSSGHLGEGLARVLRGQGKEVVTLDLIAGGYTDCRGSIVDSELVGRAMKGIDVVFHTATLHKPHIATHTRQAFVDTNITGTLNLLEEARRNGVRAFVFTSTTSTFGHALHPGPGKPAAWITETVTPIPKNIYGITKLSAENLCALFHQRFAMPCIVLRTSRFFPEDDDNADLRETYDATNLKVNEFLYRRVDLEDVVSAHLAAADRAAMLGFGTYIISATTPFDQSDCVALGRDAPSVLSRRISYETTYQRLGWRMLPTLDRVYVNTRAQTELGWQPRHDFKRVLDRVASGEPAFSRLARQVGSKGYHDEQFDQGPYPTQ